MKKQWLLGLVILVGTGCDEVVVESTECRTWGCWRMPNPASAGLPNPAHYTIDAANGIVTDDVTHLMWQRDVDGEPYLRAEANTYCANLVLGNHDDWRLPTRIELVSLIDFTKQDPAIDSTAFPNTRGTLFWTSSSMVDWFDGTWHVDFYYGTTGGSDSNHDGRVRCVR